MTDPLTTYAANLASLVLDAEHWRKECADKLHAQDALLIDREEWERIVAAAGSYPQPAQPKTRWLPEGCDTAEYEDEHATPEAAAVAWLRDDSPYLELGKEWPVPVCEWREMHGPPGPDCGFEWQPGDTWWQPTGNRAVVKFWLGAKTEVAMYTRPVGTTA